jgi:hypothetical protein
MAGTSGRSSPRPRTCYFEELVLGQQLLHRIDGAVSIDVLREYVESQGE